MTNNYRVGADGFLCLGPGLANHGLPDPLAAYKTYFGNSAGAKSIGTLLSTRRAEVLLFHSCTSD